MGSIINTLVGTPFMNGGRDVKIGLDCWGLVIEVYKRYGSPCPDFTVDSFAFKAIDALANQETETKIWEEVHNPHEGDEPLVVLMRMHPRLITHAGVFVGGNRIIHTTKSTNAVISRVNVLKSHITGYYRLCLK